MSPESGPFIHQVIHDRHSVKLTNDCSVKQADVLRETAMKGLSITFVSSYRRTLRTAAGRQPSPCRSLSSLPLCSSHWSLSSKPKRTHQSSIQQVAKGFFFNLNKRNVDGETVSAADRPHFAAQIKGYTRFSLKPVID